MVDSIRKALHLGRRRGSRRSFAAMPLAALGLVAITLAACSGGSSGTTTTSSPTASTTGSAPRTTAYRWGVVGNAGKIEQLELHTPTAIAGAPTDVVQIATSNSDGYALTSNGQVYGWGVNSSGELGDGHLTPYDTAAVKVDFPAGVKITALANPMPFDAGLAIDSSGNVWGWGLDGDGDLCLSGGIESHPVRLPLSHVTQATGARTHSLFDASGVVYACGSGDAGELGNGSTASSTTPTRVLGLPGLRVTALTSSWEGSGALLANGDYYNWGYNAAGQLGNGTTANSAVPVHVHLEAPVHQVFQGGSGPKNGQTIAILDDGSVWAWGDNDRGQLGIGTRTDSHLPVRVHVPRHITIVRVSSGGYASYAIDSSGRLWAWGDNTNGQLGTDSGQIHESLPLDVGIHLTQVSSTAQNVAGLSVHS